MNKSCPWCGEEMHEFYKPTRTFRICSNVNCDYFED